jgi:hypothetical protein
MGSQLSDIDMWLEYITRCVMPASPPWVLQPAEFIIYHLCCCHAASGVPSTCLSIFYLLCHVFPSTTSLDLRRECSAGVTTDQVTSSQFVSLNTTPLSLFITPPHADVCYTTNHNLLSGDIQLFSPNLELLQLTQISECVLNLTAGLSQTLFIIMLLLTGLTLVY